MYISGQLKWAPMMPGISLSISFGRDYQMPYDRWVFVESRDFSRSDIHHHRIDRSRNTTIINNSTVINNTYYDNSRHTTYISGPGRQDVEKVTGRTIKPITVREKDKPGEILNNDQIQIYRPEVQKNKNENRLAPVKVTDIKDVKRIPGSNTQKQPQNKQILKDQTGKDQQPGVNPTNNSTNKNTGQKQSTNPPNKNTNKEKQPAVNPTNKSNNKENTPPNRNTDSLNTNTNKEKQSVVNQVNKNNSKENPNQSPKKK